METEFFLVKFSSWSLVTCNYIDNIYSVITWICWKAETVAKLV